MGVVVVRDRDGERSGPLPASPLRAYGGGVGVYRCHGAAWLWETTSSRHGQLLMECGLHLDWLHCLFAQERAEFLKSQAQGDAARLEAEHAAAQRLVEEAAAARSVVRAVGVAGSRVSMFSSGHGIGSPGLSWFQLQCLVCQR